MEHGMNDMDDFMLMLKPLAPYLYDFRMAT